MEEILAVQLTRKPFAFDAFTDPKRNVQTTKSWIPEATLVVELEDISIYKRTSADSEGFVEWYFAVSADGISRYVVKLADVKAAPLRSACQVGVWSDSSFVTSVAIAPRVFWGILFENHDMISDSIQTEHGQRFWRWRVGEAFNYGFCVYWLKLKGSKIIEVKRLRDRTAFNALSREIWGTALKMRNTRLAITKNPLRFE